MQWNGTVPYTYLQNVRLQATMPSSMSSTEQRAGDPAAAFEAAYERHRSRLFGYLLRRLGSPEEAEDALAETFEEAWRS